MTKMVTEKIRHRKITYRKKQNINFQAVSGVMWIKLKSKSSW